MVQQIQSNFFLFKFRPQIKLLDEVITFLNFTSELNSFFKSFTNIYLNFNNSESALCEQGNPPSRLYSADHT